MRIFLKILGFLFTAVLTVSIPMFCILANYSFDVNAVISVVKEEDPFVTCMGAVVLICFGFASVGMRVWDLISKTIDDRYPIHNDWSL